MSFTKKYKCLDKVFNMSYGEYNYDKNETKFVKSLYKTLDFVQTKLKAGSVEINLVDPQTRLEGDEKIFDE
jgi:hypothetical protein